MMKTIKLKFEGPFGFFGPEGKILFDQPVANKSGIYIWGVSRPDGFLVNYVGETRTSFWKRHKRHLQGYLNGTWLRWTYRPRAFKNGNKKRIWDGEYQAGIKEFRKRREELTPKVRAFLNAIQIYVAPTRVDNLTRKRVESAIAIHLWKQPYPVGDFIDPDHRYPGNPSKDIKALVKIQSPTKFIGLGDEIEVWLPRV